MSQKVINEGVSLYRKTQQGQAGLMRKIFRVRREIDIIYYIFKNIAINAQLIQCVGLSFDSTRAASLLKRFRKPKV